MSAPARTSLIVVSRHRPDQLRLCLKAITYLDHPDFELIVVADPASAADARETAPAAKCVVFDEANISAARNEGLAQAAGEVVAFLDDDAVPEPTWLSRLTAPFADPRVDAAGGFVLGRNGISFQWKASTTDGTGTIASLAVDEVSPSLHRPPSGGAIRTEGTNCAFRRSALLAIGGFDPAFRFYLDETDVNMRLAALGGFTAIVPLAQVHHGYAGSSRRDSARVPRDLRDIGASTAVFLRRYCTESRHATALDAVRIRERNRLIVHMVSGGIEPPDVVRMMAGLEAGIAEGLSRPLPDRSPLADDPPAFRRFPARALPPLLLAGRHFRRRGLRRRAAEAAGSHTVTLLLFSRTAIFHRMRFVPAGYWEQKGGLFGRSGRAGPIFRYVRFGRRVAEEAARIAAVRPVGAADNCP